MGCTDTKRAPVLSCPECLLGLQWTFPKRTGCRANGSCQMVVVGRVWCLTSGSDQTLVLLRWAISRKLTPKPSLRLLVDVLWLSGSMIALVNHSRVDDPTFQWSRQDWLILTEDVWASFTCVFIFWIFFSINLLCTARVTSQLNKQWFVTHSNPVLESYPFFSLSLNILLEVPSVRSSDLAKE